MHPLVALGIGLTLLTSGCFAKVYELPPLGSESAAFASSDEPPVLVGLAISGGGSRAATFTSGALEALAELRLSESGRDTSLMERVTHLSSVSGGSLAAAYYAVNKPDKGTPMLEGAGLSPAYRNFFAQYQADMQRNFESRAAIRQALFLRAFNSTKFAYSFSEVWDSTFFHDITLGRFYTDREKPGHSPRLILNGTLYNNGRRFVLTTLPRSEFAYDFFSHLRDDILARRPGASSNELAFIQRRLEQSEHQLLPVTFDDDTVRLDPRNLPLSLAVATSASFPPIVGPVTYRVKGGASTKDARYLHVGDGGLFDNLGIESLSQVFLNTLSQDKQKRALVVVIDASYPFDVEDRTLGGQAKGFEVFVEDPSRIVGIMEQRAIAYQMVLWAILRSEKILLPDFDHLRLVFLKHTDAQWKGFDELPPQCRKDFSRDVTGKEIREVISRIPTRFEIKTCDGALLIKAAHKVVEQNRDRILGFFQEQR